MGSAALLQRSSVRWNDVVEIGHGGAREPLGMWKVSAALSQPQCHSRLRGTNQADACLVEPQVLLHDPQHFLR